MKHPLLKKSGILTLLLAAFTLTATAQKAQHVTVSTGPGNEQQVWYNLKKGEVSRKPKDNWDLAFATDQFSGTILANTQKGLTVFQSPYAVSQWANVDTTGINDWPQLQNSDTSWDYGALNQNPTNEYDLGWGIYNPASHAVEGDSIFVIQMASGKFIKLRINEQAGGEFNFTYADLDGSNQKTGRVSKQVFINKNFGYYSLENNAVLNREPVSFDWDLTFTKFLAYTPDLYPVAGVLTNKGVTVAKAAKVDTANVQYKDYTFGTAINTIGYDWKSFGGMSYIMEDSLVYFVTDREGDIWQLTFTGYSGSAKGEFSFNKRMLTGSSSVSDGMTAAGRMALSPNPATPNGNIYIALETTAAQYARIQITDLNGKVKLQNNLQLTGGLNAVSLSAADLQPGVYLVRATGSDWQCTQKLVIQ